MRFFFGSINHRKQPYLIQTNILCKQKRTDMDKWTWEEKTYREIIWNCLPAQTRLNDGGELIQNKRNNTSWYCPEKCLNRWRWTFSSLYWSSPHSFQSLQCFFFYWLLSWRPELLKPQKNSFQWIYKKFNHSIAHITLKLEHKQTQQIQNHSFTTCFELVYRLTFLIQLK